MRAALSKSIGSNAQLVASVVNALQIQFFNYYYETLVDDLTEWENHRQVCDVFNQYDFVLRAFFDF